MARAGHKRRRAAVRGPNAAHAAGEWREPCHLLELRVQPALRYVDIDFLAFANYYFTYWNVLDKTDGSLRTERYRFDTFVNKMQVSITRWSQRLYALVHASTCTIEYVFQSRKLRIPCIRVN